MPVGKKRAFRGFRDLSESDTILLGYGKDEETSMRDFRGKTAFVTGGASGIGLGMARAFGKAGMNVVLADIETDAAKAAAEQLASEQIKAHPVTCDVTERAAVREAALETIAKFGKIHVVCNNAGIAAGGVIGATKPGDWDWTFAVNLYGVIYGVETFVPLIESHGEGGHIVNTASLAGLISGPGTEPYSASKFAVVAMSEGWAFQLAPRGIGISVLCPGFVRTNIFNAVRNRQARFGKDAGTFGSPAARERMVKLLDQGISPDIVGERVLEGVKAGELYIITDPRFRDFVELRFANIRAAFDAAEKSQALKAVKQWPPMPSPGPQSADN
jgi:NAD(P)-dependent dehydrogenase (short-subunit alcohol dehydrogenase family)